jgi:expansin (peptidoglycan-binding protein)
MSVLRLSLLASLLVALVAAQGQELLPSTQPAEQLDQGTWTSGNATFTGVPAGTLNSDFDTTSVKAVPNGACGYGVLTSSQYPSFLLAGVGASNPLTQGPQNGCGTCLEVQCTSNDLCDNNNPITVMVYDSCDECEANQINLYATAFSKFASLDIGRIGIQYRQVPCPFNGSLTVHIDTFRPSKGGYIKLSLRNVAGTAGINSIAFRTTGTANNWRPLKNTFGAVWEGSQLSNLPLDLQVTKANGTSVVLSGVITKATVPGDIKTATNFRA